MKLNLVVFLLSLGLSCTLSGAGNHARQIRVLVVTGGHEYNRVEFDSMFSSFLPSVTFKVVEFPEAFRMFEPGNRQEYDVLVFYHMWQEITAGQERMMADCIREGKPLVALHHSICAFDTWPEYWAILGGKYFHSPTVLNGKEYQACSYIHDIRFRAEVCKQHPVTKGITGMDLFDETYKGYYVDEGVVPLLKTDEPSSNEVIGWAKKYGKARVVVLQSGHDVPTFRNPVYRRLLLQAIKWVSEPTKMVSGR